MSQFMRSFLWKVLWVLYNYCVRMGAGWVNAVFGMIII